METASGRRDGHPGQLFLTKAFAAGSPARVSVVGLPKWPSQPPTSGSSREGFLPGERSRDVSGRRGDHVGHASRRKAIA